MDLRHLYDEWNASRDYEAAHPLTAFSAGFNLARSMAIKPLEWTCDDQLWLDEDSREVFYHQAETPLGPYTVVEYSTGEVVLAYHAHMDYASESFDSVDEAKRAAQKHWAEWLAPALT